MPSNSNFDDTTPSDSNLEAKLEDIRRAQIDLEKYAAQIERRSETWNNRRCSLDMAQRFFNRAGTGVVSAEAVIHLAEMYFKYFDNGTLPDLEQAKEVTEEFTRNVVSAAFPPSLQTKLRGV